MPAGYDTPEEAALSSYSSSAGAHVLRTEVLDDDHVDVIIDTIPSHPMRIHTHRSSGRWHDVGDITE